MLKILIITICLIYNLYSDNNITNPHIINQTVEYNIPTEVNDANKSKWNSSNWGKKLSGDTNGTAGNTMMFMNHSSFLKKGMTTDTSKLTTEAYNSDSNASAAASGYTDNYRTTVMSGTIANTAYKANSNTDNNTLKCFMARDLPFRYKCEETGLVYGGATIATATNGVVSNMDGMSGKEALNLCKENCKRHVDCQEVSTVAALNVALADKNFSFDSNSSYSGLYSGLDYGKRVKDLTFELNTTVVRNIDNAEVNSSKVFVDIVYVDKNDKNIELVKHVWTKLMRGSENIAIGESLKSISIKVYSEDADANINGRVFNVSLNYESNSKYVCAPFQDISEQNLEKFGYTCPNGVQVTFGAIKICSKGVNAGDNTDGTYSNKKACNNQCNITKKCNVETGSFDATIFEHMREGRLGSISANGTYTSADSNTISSDVDCTNARATKQKVINETSFDAKNIPYQTVLNSSLVPNVDRPRVLSSSNVNYETQKKEEWKDSAYQTMLQQGTYSSTASTIGENTLSHFAYFLNLTSGSSYGNTNTSTRSFIWKLKPNALFYNDNKTYKLYAVVKVDVEKHKNTINGNEVVRDQIWYVKTSSADTFTPFLRAEHYATSTIVNTGTGMLPLLSYDGSATFSAQSFNGTDWISSSFSNTAPSFQATSFLPNDFWYEFKIFDSIGDIANEIPGLVRSSVTTNGGVTTNTYSGNFNGTGDSVAGYEIYTFFSETSLTYQDLKTKIDAIDSDKDKKHQVDNYGAKIYKFMDEKKYDKFINGDNTETSSNVEIYQYGGANNNSLKVRIKPKKEDIGKNGFVYIFMY